MAEGESRAALKACSVPMHDGGGAARALFSTDASVQQRAKSQDPVKPAIMLPVA